MIKKYVFSLIFLIQLQHSYGFAINELKLLEEQSTILNECLGYLFPRDRARGSLIKKQIDKSIKDLKENEPISMVVMDSMYNYYIVFHYSNDFFKQLNKGIFKEPINKLLKNFTIISDARGFAKKAFLSVTSSYFTQVYTLFKELEKEDIPETAFKIFYKGERSIVADIGDIVAQANASGDTLQTFLKAKQFYKKWVEEKELYSQFDNYLNQGRVFDLSFQIMGILEFYSSFLKVQDLNE